MRPLAIPDDREFPFSKSDDGSLWRFNGRKFLWEPLKGHKKKDGYYIVVWNAQFRVRRTAFLHRIVWELHHGPIPAGLEIDHIDGDKGHNTIDNLRLISHRENILYARQRLGNWSAKLAKLKPHQRALVLLLPSSANWKALAERWGVHKVTLLTIRCNAKK